MPLFGHFNYGKAGPGISKNGPQKRTFIVFFETYFRNFWKFMPISLVYSLISLPQLTSGLASVGITRIARNTAREKHTFGLSDYFEALVKNWKQALACGIINTAVYALLLFNAYFFYLQENKFGIVALGFTLAVLFVFTVMNFYIWTLIITFSLSLKAVYKNSLKFVFINLKGNLICFFSLVAVLAVFLVPSVILWGLKGKLFETLAYLISVMQVLCYPSFKFLLIQFCVFPSIKKCIIDPYYAAHPNEDLERRRALGVYEDEVDTEERDFYD